jgi:hypothetical protein
MYMLCDVNAVWLMHYSIKFPWKEYAGKCPYGAPKMVIILSSSFFARHNYFFPFFLFLFSFEIFVLLK